MAQFEFSCTYPAHGHDVQQNVGLTFFIQRLQTLFYFCHVFTFLTFLYFCLNVFIARRYASAVLDVNVCLFVCLSICLSVRPSGTSRSCTKMAKPRITIRTAYDSSGTPVFRSQKSWRNSNDIIPNGGANRHRQSVG